MTCTDAVIRTPLDDYELIDFGDGRKLERFGPYLVDRPAPQATGPRVLADWRPEWLYTGGRTAAGSWRPRDQKLPDAWPITVDGFTVHLKLAGGGQVGLYPEHVACWRWIGERLHGCYHIENLRVLNLFGGSGGATAAALRAGADVTHVDAQKAALAQARSNAGDKGVRWIREDVMTFVRRAARRGEAYDLIVIDPPSFGRGPKGQTWDIRRDLVPLVKTLAQLMSPECRGVWLSAHSPDWGADALAQLLIDALPSRSVVRLALGTSTSDGRALPAGVAACWADDRDFLTSHGGPSSLSAAQIEERLDPYLDPVLSSRRTAAEPARRLVAFEREQQEFVLRWSELIARSNHPEMAYQFAGYAPQALGAMNEATLEAWIVHAMDAYDRTGLYEGIAVLREVEAFAERVQQQASGAAFENVAGVLEKFVHGLGGRKLKLESAEQPYTDTGTVFLPALVVRFPSHADNFRLYKAMVVHLWAQNWFGTWRAPVAELVGGFDAPDKALRLFHALETVRLDACIERALPGVWREMAALCAALGESLLPPGWETHAARLRHPAATAQDSCALLAQLYAGAVPAPLCHQGRLLPERVAQVRAQRMAKEKDALGMVLVRLADEARARLDRDAVLPESAEQAPPRFRLRRESDEQVPDGFRLELELDGRPLRPPDEAWSLLGSIIQDLGEIPDDYLVPAGDGAYHPLPSGADADRSKDVWKGSYHEEGAFLYNEWDYKRSHYRKNWCALREVDGGAGRDDFARNTLARYGGLVRNLRRSFEALRGEDKVLKKQPNGDEVDIDALVEAYADARSGREMSDQLFMKRHKVERNIAVMFMVDMSGSTKGWINDAEREALVLLCEALEVLGDRYAIYGFSGMTRKRCELYRVKRFAEPYGDEVKRRIAGIAPRDYTRMGVTIRHLCTLLNQVEARTKLLVTLSDGKPDDIDGYRSDYGIEDTRMALIEAKRSGIHPFCITIDKEARDYLPHMYGAVNYALVDEVRKLPLKVADIYRRLTM